MMGRWRAIPVAALVCVAAAVAGAQDAPSGTTTATVGLFGRGVQVNEDSAKYREDYDSLQSGGGLDFFIDDQRDDGVYGTAGGSLLFTERGDTFDGAELAIAGGRWGMYHFRGEISLLQSFFDDSRGGPLGAFPFTNELGRELHTNRANIDLEAKAFVGDGGWIRLRYLHDELGGDRSLNKGSRVEGLSPFSFRAPSFQEIDRQSDGVELAVVVPLGPIDLALDAGYRAEDNETITRETNHGPTALRDRVAFSDAFDVDVYQGGVSVSATDDPRVQGHAGYRVAYVDATGESMQTGGPSGLDPRRRSDDVEVDSWSHVGHAGLIVRPVTGLAIRASYALRDLDRTGSGTEQRMAAIGPTTQQLRNRSQRSSLSHSPRVSASYSGLPRTHLRASYSFDQIDRDLSSRSLTDTAGPAAIDRIQSIDEDVYRHKVKLGARVRIMRRATGELGLEMLREEIDQSVDELVNEVVLGDRDRERDRIFARLRIRAPRGSTLLLGGEWSRNELDRTDIDGNSSAEVEGYRVSAQLTSRPLSGVSTNATVAYVDRDTEVGESTARTLSIFRDIEFRDRHLAGALLASWAVTPDLSLRGRYSVAYVEGSLDNISHRAHLDAGYQATELLRLAAGYSFLGFDEDLFADDDFDGHFAWARCEVSF